MSDSKTKLTVQQTVWPWDKPLIPPESADVARKQRAFIQFCVMFIVASVIVVISKSSHLWLPMIIYLLSILVAVGGYWVPPLFEAFERFGRFLAKAVGAALTYILLVPFFYLCFVPGRFILQAFGKDPLRRQWRKDLPTYWSDKQTRGGVERYKRQF